MSVVERENLKETIKNSTDYYDFEKSKAKTIKEGEIIEGFQIAYVCDGIILVESNCKECAQQLRLFEALAYGDLCENCFRSELTIIEVARQLCDGLDKDINDVAKRLEKYLIDHPMTLKELNNKCWIDSNAMFDAIM